MKDHPKKGQIFICFLRFHFSLCMKVETIVNFLKIFEMIIIKSSFFIYNFYFQSISMNYQNLYKQKLQEFQELNLQFQLYSEQSKNIIDDLQQQNRNLRQKHIQISKQHQTLKNKWKDNRNVWQRENQSTKRQLESLKGKWKGMNQQVIQLENRNETLENQLRAANMLLGEYEEKVDQTMQELACLNMQLQEKQETSKEQITRLKSQIQETQEELHVIRMKHQKHHDQSSLRMSNYSWASKSTTKKWKDSINFAQNEPIPSQMMKKIDFQASIMVKENKGGFQETMSMMNGLLVELDKRCLKVKCNNKKNPL